MFVIMYAGLRAVRMALLPAAAALMLAVQVEEAAGLPDWAAAGQKC